MRQPYPNGDGDALLAASHLIEKNEAFLVLFGDDIIKTRGKSCVASMIDVYEKHHAPVVAVEKVARKDVSKYGIIEPKKVGNRLWSITSMVEKPSVAKAPSRLAAVGKYILTQDIFKHLRAADPKKGEVRISSHGIRPLLKERDFFAYEFDGKRFDTGSKLGYLMATVDFALENPDLKKDFLKYLKKRI